MSSWKEDLLDIVKEKGVVDIILEYKRQIELYEMEEMRMNILCLYRNCRIYKEDIVSSNLLLKEEIREYFKIKELEERYNEFCRNIL